MADDPHSDDPVIAARRHSTRHRDEVLGSAICGCYYCLAAFPPAEIEQWIDADQTAICPRCGVDAVIGSAAGFPITRTFLAKMYERWYAACS